MGFQTWMNISLLTYHSINYLSSPAKIHLQLSDISLSRYARTGHAKSLPIPSSNNITIKHRESWRWSHALRRSTRKLSYSLHWRTIERRSAAELILSPSHHSVRNHPYQTARHISYLDFFSTKKLFATMRPYLRKSMLLTLMRKMKGLPNVFEYLPSLYFPYNGIMYICIPRLVAL